jgi:molybdate transport system permease protein
MAQSPVPETEEPAPFQPQLMNVWRTLSLPMVAFLSLPLLALFMRTSLEQLIANLNQPQVLQAISLSLVTTMVSTVIIVLFGTPTAFALAHDSSRLSRLVDTVVDLPTVLPPAVAGVALLMAFGRRGIFGDLLGVLDLDIAFTGAAVVLAQTFIASPFYIKAAKLGFASIEPELEQAAALDGASNWQVFRYVTIPLSRSALLGGSVMSWARALGEFGATIIFAGNFPGRTQTMPLAIYLGFELDLDVALTLSVILVGFSFLALILIKGVLRRTLTG